MRLYQKLDLIEKLKDNFELTLQELDYLKSLDVYDSIHLEGNTLTREEITNYLLHSVTVHSKPLKEYYECKNYAEMLKLLTINLTPDFELSSMFIRFVHKSIMDELLEVQFCGYYRNDGVHLRTSSYIPPDAIFVSELIEEVCDTYNQYDEASQTRFENIIETFYKFERVHPFFDGNGRTGRLLMNYLLLSNRYSFLWINARYRTEYLDSFDCFDCFDTSLEFHADRILEVYEMLRQRRDLNRSMTNMTIF